MARVTVVAWGVACGDGGAAGGVNDVGDAGDRVADTAPAIPGGHPDGTDGPATAPGEPEPSPPQGPGLAHDRCLVGSCGPIALPEQPELTFLEDMGDGWQRLMEADWALAGGTEGYRCMTLTIPEDTYITEFSPQSPAGTHHATFGVSSQASGPDTVVACGVGASGERKLHGSGAGSEALALPPGVAMRLGRGEQVLMNLHLFNTSEGELRGRSGMWVKTVPAEQVEYEAEAVLAGPLALDIPGGRSTVGGACTLRADTTIYGLGPHMHQSGVHMVVTAQTETGDVVLFDDAYDFNHQLFYPIEPLAMRAGERVQVDCTYENDSGHTLHWGDSSLDEMCFASLGLFPAIGYGGTPCFY